VEVVTVEPVPYSIVATLEIAAGPCPCVVQDAAEAALAAYCDARHLVGRPVALSGIYEALHQPGVERVLLTSPAADLTPTATQTLYCAAATITTFLQDLPPAALDTVPGVGYLDAVACRNAWLRAVEEAAKELPHD
jgi:hypothetical protein